MKKFISISLMFLAVIFANIYSVSAQKKKPSAKKPAAKKIIPAKLTADYSAVKVTQIDVSQLKALLQQSAAGKKPLLINFWATWCDPCREEFPDLVKLNADFISKNVDFAFISLDDLAEIKRDVPKFLVEMKAEKLLSFLLKTDNEEAAIAAVDSTWQGGLPFTVLLDSEGKVAYRKMGRIKPEILRAEIEKLLARQSK